MSAIRLHSMTDLHARIAVRAYFMWEAAGRAHGEHEAHWLAAEAVERAEAMPGLCGPVTSSADVHDLPPGYAPQHIEHVFAFHEVLRAKAAKRSAAALKGASTRKANRERAAITVAAVTVEKRARIAARDAAASVAR